ncbi:MAG: hypothetical protein ACRD3K_06740, partial [Edaphobacter sp.]
ISGNAVIDSQARIGGDTVILGGNAVYETDDSLSGSAYVLGGHLSHVSQAKGKSLGRQRFTLGPLFFWLLAALALLLLSVAIAPKMRKHPAVGQSIQADGFFK